jgi:hypothetical protein
LHRLVGRRAVLHVWAGGPVSPTSASPLWTWEQFFVIQFNFIMYMHSFFHY